MVGVLDYAKVLLQVVVGTKSCGHLKGGVTGIHPLPLLDPSLKYVTSYSAPRPHSLPLE